MTSGNNGHAGALGGGEGAGVERSKPGTGPKVPSGKKARELPRAALRISRRASARPAGAIIAGDEVRSDAGQQQSGQRHGTHLALDDEAEARRECRREHHAVQIAAVVGDDDTGIGRGPRKCTLTGMPISVRTLRPIQRVRRRRVPRAGRITSSGSEPSARAMNTVAAYRCRPT